MSKPADTVNTYTLETFLLLSRNRPAIGVIHLSELTLVRQTILSPSCPHTVVSKVHQRLSLD